MVIKIFNWIFVIAGFIGNASYIIGFLLSPFALYKGFVKKDWAFGKILLMMIVGGIVAVVVSLLAIMAIKFIK